MHFVAVYPYTDSFLVALDHKALVPDLSHHVERLYGFPVESQLLHVCRHVLLDRGFHLLFDLEEPVRRAKPFDALVRTLVVVVFYPVSETLLSFIERFELGPLEIVILQRLPEAFDFPKRLRMMRA